MKLYLLSQTVNNTWDTYDRIVVAALNESEAREIHPEEWRKPKWGSEYTGWAYSPEQVYVEYIGEAKEGTEAGIIVASFNAG